MTTALVLGALLAAACVVLVALPYLREPAPADDALEERDRALAALTELEHDHRAGKISDADYRQLVGPLRREAAEALRALEPRAQAPARVRSDV